MPGKSAEPYFEGQKPSFCGCYYPDVTRLSDNIKKKRRICFCIRHGKFSFKLDRNTKPTKDVQEIPTDKWREVERTRISTKT